jgi:hypothetical protein
MTQKGLVAFFDILGYQDIIDNNLIEEVARIISDILVKIPADVKNEFMGLLKKGSKQYNLFQVFIESIDQRVISDSILLSLDFPEDEKEHIKVARWTVFLLYVRLLVYTAFEKGLPLRGAIDYGEFFIDSNCFAGKPIIDCYRLSNRLEFSGCVLTPSCEKTLQNALKGLVDNAIPLDIISSEVLSYLVPLKDGEERLWIIAWIQANQIVGDVRQFVVKAFQSHNKDMSRKVFTKLDNTEIMIRCLIERTVR